MAGERLKGTLKARARSWAGQLTSLSRKYAPKHLRRYISSKVEEKGEGTFIIRVSVDRNANPTGPGHWNYGSSDARAQEYGSGLWAQRGAKHWIPILPKNKRNLAFPYPADKVYPGALYVDGKIITSKVMHPGIHAANNDSGYLRPARDELRRRARKELSQEVRRAILGDIRESFGRKK